MLLVILDLNHLNQATIIMADTTKKNDTKGNTKKTVAQKIKKAVLGNTGATVGGVAVFAVIALLGFAGITVLRKRA